MFARPTHRPLVALLFGLLIPACDGSGDTKHTQPEGTRADSGPDSGPDSGTDAGPRSGGPDGGRKAGFGCVPGGCERDEYCNTKTRKCEPADQSDCEGVCPAPTPSLDSGPVPTSCVALGCLDAGVCDADSGLCYPPEPIRFDCARSGCNPREVCVAETGQCRAETCADTGCEPGSLCSTRTGQCEPDTCVRTGCAADQDCNAKTGLCAPASPPPPGPCDPLRADACTENQGSVWTGASFKCIDLRVQAPAGSACEGDNDCRLGTACVPQGLAPGCGGDHCCAAFCDRNSETPCSAAKLCKPSPNWPVKEVGVCVFDGLTSCDPLSQDPCASGYACSWTPELLTFICLVPTAPSEKGAVCTGPDSCAPGLACIPPTSGTPCVGDKCCAGDQCCAELCEKNTTDCAPLSQCVDVPAWAPVLPEAGACEELAAVPVVP
ncbi:MAG: hypothetical protein RJA70_207 [Pseudomonadota bacterium]|jgi:hypothetical protein